MEQKETLQPLTAAHVGAAISIRAAARFNVLQLIATSRPSFDATRKYQRIWDALIGDWAWSTLATVAGLAEMDAKDPKWSEKLDVFVLSRAVMEDLRDLIKAKLDEKAPAGAALDDRWPGRIAIIELELHDDLTVLLAKDHA